MSYPPVKALFRHALGAVYENRKEFGNEIRKKTINFLVSLPEKVIDDAYNDLQNKYQVKNGGGILKIVLLGQLAKFYLDYRKAHFPKKKKKSKEKKKEK